MTDQDYVNKLLANVHHMVISVVLADGTPWAVPVHIKHFKDNIFEWESSVNAEHSKAIKLNNIIALTIFSAEYDLGFYAKATAEVLADTESEHGRARYRATVTECWLNESHIKRRLN